VAFACRGDDYFLGYKFCQYQGAAKSRLFGSANLYAAIYRNVSDFAYRKPSKAALRLLET
jgi:hypothetical protein